MKRLTPRQAQILEAMISHLLEHHTHAKVRDLGAAVGISSTNAVADHLAALARKGYVQHVPKTGGRLGGHYRILRTPAGAPFALAVRHPGQKEGVCTLSPTLHLFANPPNRRSP